MERSGSSQRDEPERTAATELFRIKMGFGVVDVTAIIACINGVVCGECGPSGVCYMIPRKSTGFTGEQRASTIAIAGGFRRRAARSRGSNDDRGVMQGAGQRLAPASQFLRRAARWR